MPKYLSWSWCNNRTQVHNKCNAHQSPQNHAPPKSMEKLSSTKSVPGAKKVGTADLDDLSRTGGEWDWEKNDQQSHWQQGGRPVWESIEMF